MAKDWGVIEERDEGGKFMAYHVMPMIHVDTETIPSAAHDLSDAGPCHPNLMRGKGGWKIWDHHDATHQGSYESEKENSLTSAEKRFKVN